LLPRSKRTGGDEQTSQEEKGKASLGLPVFHVAGKRSGKKKPHVQPRKRGTSGGRVQRGDGRGDARQNYRSMEKNEYTRGPT